MLFSVCNAVTVECCVLYPWCMGMFAVMEERRYFSSIFAITERRDIGRYEMPLTMPLLGFRIWTILANFHMCCIMLLRSVLNILVRNMSRRGPMCFMCLVFSLPGVCELLFVLCFIASWT